MDSQQPLLVRGPSANSNAWQHVRSQSVDCLDIPDDGVEVTVGVLSKYAGSKGWRPRLFVLEGDVLRYYQAGQAAAADAAALVADLRRRSNSGAFTLRLIGAQTGVLEARLRRRENAAAALERQRARAHNNGNGNGKPRTPPPTASSSYETLGHVHVAVATATPARSDPRRFTVNTGTAALHCRAETCDDQRAWVRALAAAQGRWARSQQHQSAAALDGGGGSPNAHSGNGNGHLSGGALAVVQATSDDVVAALRAGGAAPPLVAAVTQLLARQQGALRAALADADAAARRESRALHRYAARLEDERRELATAAAVAAADDAAAGGGSHGASPSPDACSLLQGVSDDASYGGGDDDVGGSDEEHGSSRATRALAHQLSAFSDAPPPSLPVLGGRGGGGTADAVDADADDDDADALSEWQSCSAHSFDSSGTAAAAVGAADVSGSGGPNSLDCTPDTTTAAAAPRRRERLPGANEPPPRPSLWSLLRSFVGKDLARVCLPAAFNEPLGALQKAAEELEYSWLLDAALAHPPGSPERLLRVAAFALSPYRAAALRTHKPFNPLLGETYELVCAERRVRFLAEKVCHHPTVVAFRADGGGAHGGAHGDGCGWALEGDADMRSRFWGRSIEVTPVGQLRASFPDGDVYVWSKATTLINNIILGRLRVEHTGVVHVTHVAGAGNGGASGLSARLRFVPPGFLDRGGGGGGGGRRVEGELLRHGAPLPGYAIEGEWDAALYARLGGNGAVEQLWRAAPLPQGGGGYRLSAFAAGLNELRDGDRQSLPRTDSRLRPDQRCLELGALADADAHKQRLEQRQRAARRRADAGERHAPRFFARVPGAAPGEALCYRYVGGYWEARAAGALGGTGPAIFECDGDGGGENGGGGVAAAS